MNENKINNLKLNTHYIFTEEKKNLEEIIELIFKDYIKKYG